MAENQRTSNHEDRAVFVDMWKAGSGGFFGGIIETRQIIANSQAAQFQASRDLNIVLRSLLKQFTSPQSQMRIKELIMATLVRSFTRVTENQSGKPLMALAVRADTL